MSRSAGERVKERYSGRQARPFPTNEIARVMPNDTDERSIFHARLDLFLANIAGYASSADRLKLRGAGDLGKARQFLSSGFFEKFAEYESIKGLINPHNTPVLFEDMHEAEVDRIDLLEEVTRLLAEGPSFE